LEISVEQNTKRDLSDQEREDWKQRKKWGKAELNCTKEKIKKIKCGEEDGEGWVPTFNQRPVRAEVLQNAVQDVTVLPNIYRHCMMHLKEMEDDGGMAWKDRIVLETDMRIAASQAEDFEVSNPNRKHDVPVWKGIK
jgi:hypothetical protein